VGVPTVRTQRLRQYGDGCERSVPDAPVATRNTYVMSAKFLPTESYLFI